MKNKWFQISIFVFIGVILLRFFSNPQSSFLYLSNTYFLISIVLLIIGLFGLILKEGTFDLFHYSLNQVKGKFFNPENSNAKKTHLHRLSQAIPSAYTSFIKAGLLFLVGSILCILIYSLL